MADTLVIPNLFKKKVKPKRLQRLSRYEGGLNTKEVGGGGVSNMGVTQDTYNAYRKGKNLPIEDVKNITIEEKDSIFDNEFYEKPKLNTLPENVGDIVFDYGVNASPRKAIKDFQSVIGTKADGLIGPETQKKTNEYINQHGEKDLLKNILNKREEHNKSLIEKAPDTYKKFERGWQNRINDLKEEFDISSINPFSVKEANAAVVSDKVIPNLFETSESNPNVVKGLFGKSKSIAQEGKEVVTEAGKASLRGFEGLFSGMGSTVNWIGENIKDGIPQGAMKAVTPGAKLLPEQPEMIKNIQKKVGDTISKWGKNAYSFWREESQKGIEAPDIETFKGTFMQNPSWTRGVATVAEAIPSLAGATVIGIATQNPLAGAASLGLLEGSGQYVEARQAGKSVKFANTVGGLSTIGNTILEVLPITRFIKGGEGKVIKDMFIGAVQEGGEEVLQALWQNSIAKIGYDKTRALTQGMVEGFIGGAGSGGVIGGFTSGRGTQTDTLIKEAIDKGIPTEQINSMQEAVKNQIINNADTIEEKLSESAQNEAKLYKPEVTPTESLKASTEGIVEPNKPIVGGTWQYGAEPEAAIPGEPIAFLGVKGDNLDTADAAIIYDEKDGQPLGYKIALKDGNILPNPKTDKIGGSPYFETMEEAQAYAEQSTQERPINVYRKSTLPEYNMNKALIDTDSFVDKIREQEGVRITAEEAVKQGMTEKQYINTYREGSENLPLSVVRKATSEYQQAKAQLSTPTGEGKVEIKPTKSASDSERGSIVTDMLNPARWDSVRQFIEDDWIRVKRLIQQKGVNVTETNNPYEAEIRYWGRIGARTEQADNLISDIDKDIVNTSKKAKIPDKLLSKEIDKFLIARHAPERNAKHGENAAGMTNEQAYKIQAELVKKPYAGEVERISNRIQDLNNKTLDTLLEGEVISEELYKQLRDLYKNHIPLNRVMSEEDDIVEVLTRKGFSVQGAGLKRAKGSELEVSDILTNVVANYKAALARSEKNIVDIATLKFVRDNDYFDGQFEEIKPKAIGKTFDGKIMLEQIRDPKVLPIRDKGKQVYLKINDAQMAMALKGINRQKVDGLMRGVKTFTRFYSGLMTRFNPEFVLSNKVRDLQEVAVYLASKNEMGFKGSAKAILSDPVSIKDVTDAIRGKNTEGARLYKQMRMDGGTTGGLGLSTREQLEINLDKIRGINRKFPNKAAHIVLNSIDKWNTIFEDSSRLSVYRQALKQGVSRNRAAVLAKEASVNFNKMGTGSPVVNALYMFSNASVQGSVKMLRAMKNPKTAGTVLTLLGGAIFLVAGYNDKKDKDWRKKVSKWDRLNGINVVISTNKGIKYITIPISWGLKPIKVFFDEINDLVVGHQTSVSQAVRTLLTASIEAYNPAGGTDLVSTITPSILDLPVDIARNRSWTGGKIRPDWNNSAPASIKYFNSLMKESVGRGFIKMTKEWGDRGLEISPADINYAYKQLIGGSGRFVNKVLNTIVGTSKGEVEVKEIPFASRFYRDIPEEQIREFGKSFYDLKSLLQRQDKDRFYLGQAAELAWDGLKKIPAEKRKEHYAEIKKTNPYLAERIKKVAKNEKLGLNYTDRLIKKLGVTNGERSKYLWNEISEFGSVEKRKSYYKEMKAKGIITDEVARQIKVRARLKK